MEKKRKKRKNYKQQLAEWQKKKGPHLYGNQMDSSEMIGGVNGIPVTVTEVKEQDRTNITFDCPACDRKDITGRLLKRVESSKLFFVIPIFKSTEIILTCSRCSKAFRPKARFSDLISGDKEFCNASIKYNFSTDDTYLVVGAFFLSFVPLIGLLVNCYCGIGKYSHTNNKCWQTWLLSLSFIISLVSLIAGISYLLKLYLLNS